MKKLWRYMIVPLLLAVTAWGGVSIVDITPHNPHKRCGKTVKITGEISLKHPRMVGYRFIYSDGKKTKRHLLPVAARSVRVTTKRRFDKPFDGWVKLVIYTLGKKRSSDPATLKVRCGRREAPRPISVGAVTMTAPEQGKIKCPGSVLLEGTIHLRRPGTVSYRFRTRDGEASAVRILRADRPGIYRVTYRWPVKKSFKEEVRLELLDPVKKHSEYLPVEFRCKHKPSGPAVRDPRVLSIDRTLDKCPGSVTLRGEFRHKKGVRVRVRFVTADGYATPWEELRFEKGGPYTVRYTHPVDHPLDTDYRMELRVKPLGKKGKKRSWHDFASPWEPLKVRCPKHWRDPVRTLSLEPIGDGRGCPESMEFEGAIHFKRPATVRYRFLRSDGYRTPLYTLDARRPGEYRVSYRWDLPRKLHNGWVQLIIVEPYTRRSYKAHFTRRGCASRRIPEPVSVTPAGIQGAPVPPARPWERSDGLNPWPKLILPVIAGVIANAAHTQPAAVPVSTTSTPEETTPSRADEPHSPLPLPAESAVPADQDGDGIDDATEDRLLEAFSPYYLFAKGEEYLPSDPLYQIRHARVLMANPLASAESAFAKPIVVESCSGIAEDPAKILSCTQPPADLHQTRGAMTVALDLEDARRGDPGSGRKGDWDYLKSHSSGLYGHVVPAQDGRYKIEYWQFFPYSTTASGGVEGDWKALELWYNPTSRMLEKICHSVGDKKLCMDLTQSRPVALGGEFYEYRGGNYSANPAPVSATSKERYPAAYQNNAVRFYRAPDGTMHPLVYLQRGSHDFWPTPSGALEGEQAAHGGDGESYLNAAKGSAINLGELSSPSPDSMDPQGIVLRYAGTWGRNPFRAMRRSYGPTLQCDWRLAPGELGEWTSRIRTGCGR